jgi:16S rRNA G966 N2-methylase RsmD
MLRITAGEHRGRRLKVPDVTATRPLVERAREGVMNHLCELLPDAVVLDVYAGSGILGFEALSRGAGQLFAVEKHPQAVAQLKENAALLRLGDQVRVLRMDAFKVPALLDTNVDSRNDPAGDAKPRLKTKLRMPAPDLVFFDPPYADFQRGGAKRKKVWQLFCDLAERMASAGCAVVHTPKGILLEEECAMLPGIERRDYGSTSLYWWHKPAH